MKKLANIELLRAVAVLAVVLFHSDFTVSGQPIFSYGYLGVDVFFVVSGFLITKAMLGSTGNQLVATAKFLLKRYLRVAPALYVTLLVAYVPIWYLAAPSQMLAVGETYRAIIKFTANMYFSNQDEYWNGLASFNPLLHSWSLAIEAQFYVFLALCSLIPKFKKFFVHLACGFLLISGADFVFNYDPLERDLFYLFQFRLWEFAVGCLAFVYWSNHSGRDIRRLEWVSGGALVFLLYALFLGTSFDFEPLNTLIVVILTAVVCGVQNGNPPFSQHSYFRFITYLALISYSLYLWHWPLLNLLRYLDQQIAIPVGTLFLAKLMAIFCSVVLAHISYSYVETPLRYRGDRLNFLRTLVVCSLGVAVLLLSSTISLHKGNLGRFSDDEVKLIESASASAPDNTAYVNLNFDKLVKDREFSALSARKVLLIGDSFSQDFFNILMEGGFLADVQVSAIRLRQSVLLHDKSI